MSTNVVNQLREPDVHMVLNLAGKSCWPPSAYGPIAGRKSGKIASSHMRSSQVVSSGTSLSVHAVISCLSAFVASCSDLYGPLRMDGRNRESPLPER